MMDIRLAPDAYMPIRAHEDDKEGLWERKQD